MPCMSRRFQFSLRALMVLMLAICVGLVTTMPLIHAVQGVVRLFLRSPDETYHPQAPPTNP